MNAEYLSIFLLVSWSSIIHFVSNNESTSLMFYMLCSEITFNNGKSCM